MTRNLFVTILLFTCLLVPAGAQQNDGYEVRITSPAGAKDATIEDEFIKISFPRQTHLTVVLVNKTAQPVEIDWRKAAFIDVSGKEHRVVYDDLRSLDKVDEQPPTVVPPAGRANHTVVPTGFISHEANSENWGVRELFAGGLAAYVNKPFSLRLPIKIGAETKEYLFTFVVEKTGAR